MGTISNTSKSKRLNRRKAVEFKDVFIIDVPTTLTPTMNPKTIRRRRKLNG